MNFLASFVGTIEISISMNYNNININRPTHNNSLLRDSLDHPSLASCTLKEIETNTSTICSLTMSNNDSKAEPVKEEAVAEQDMTDAESTTTSRRGVRRSLTSGSSI